MRNNAWALFLFSIIFIFLIPSYLTTSYIKQKNDYSKTKDHNDHLPDQKKNENEGYGKRKQLSRDTWTHSFFMDPKYFVQWKTNSTHITFEVQVNTLGWVGLGISPTGAMTNSDIAVMWIVNGKLTLQDRFATGFYEPLYNETQDWIALYGYENGTHTIVGFSRLLDTCDSIWDKKITKDTIRLLYAYHSEDPPGGKLMKHQNRGFRSFVLIDGIIAFKKPQYEKKLSFKVNQFTIPHENKTTYRCFLHQLKDIDKKYYMIAGNTIISPETINITHHILIHLCDAGFTNPQKLKDILCYEDSHSGDIMRHCFVTVLTVWAVGGNDINFPKGIGLPINTDLNGRWVYMEVHYNNENLTEGVIDNSAVELYLTDKPVKYEAEQLFFGLLDIAWGLMIPPKQEEYKFTAYCSQHCLSNMAIPEDGLNVFLYFLHSHIAGRKIRIKIIRNGQELEPLMKDDNYDFNYQIYRSLPKPFKILKGDAILLECIYSSLDRANYTIGGFQTSEEMCLGYMYYYPKTGFNVCGNLPSYPDLVKSLGANATMAKSGLAEMITFKRLPESLSNRDIVLKQMNSKEWTNAKGVEKLKTIYKNLEYDEICRFMSVPEIKSGKLPKYKHYQEPPSTTCT